MCRKHYAKGVVLVYNSNMIKTRKVILPTNDLNFKRLFASPKHINISRGFLQDLASYDPIGSFSITEIQIETPYNFQEVNRLISIHEYDTMLTEVDYACYDKSGVRFMLEMQKYDQTFLEERIAYNVGQKFAQFYAKDATSKKPKYVELKPVIAVIILEENHFDDEVSIRFLRPHDARFDLYKKNLNLGLEIYVELGKDATRLPRNLRLWVEYFRTGYVCEEAPCYLKEAAKMIEMTSFTKEEKELAERIERAHETRLLNEYTAQLKREKNEEETKKFEQHIAKSKEELTKLEQLSAQSKEELAKFEQLNAQSKEELAKSEQLNAQSKEELAKIKLLIAKNEEKLAKLEQLNAQKKAELKRLNQYSSN